MRNHFFHHVNFAMDFAPDYSIRNDNVWQNGMSMFAAVAEYAHDAEVVLDWMPIATVDDISAVVVMDVASTLRFTDRTGFQLRYELIHE